MPWRIPNGFYCTAAKNPACFGCFSPINSTESPPATHAKDVLAECPCDAMKIDDRDLSIQLPMLLGRRRKCARSAKEKRHMRVSATPRPCKKTWRVLSARRQRRAGPPFYSAHHGIALVPPSARKGAAMSWHRANIRHRRCGHEGGSTGTSRSGDAFMGTARPLLAALAITNRNCRGICARGSPPQSIWQVEIWPGGKHHPARMRLLRRTQAGLAADEAAAQHRWPLASPGQTIALRTGPQQHAFRDKASRMRRAHKAAARRTMATRSRSAHTTGASHIARTNYAARPPRNAGSPCAAMSSCGLCDIRRDKSAATCGIRRNLIAATAEVPRTKAAGGLRTKSLQNKTGRQDGRRVGSSLRARRRSRQPSSQESGTSLTAWQHALETFLPTKRMGPGPSSSCPRLLCLGIRPELYRSRNGQEGLPMLIWNVVFTQTPEP